MRKECRNWSISPQASSAGDNDNRIYSGALVYGYNEDLCLTKTICHVPACWKDLPEG